MTEIINPIGGGAQGPPGLVWRSAYDNSTTYGKNDAVSYNGSSFIATAGTTGVNPGSAESPNSPWAVLASGVRAGDIITGEQSISRYDATADFIAPASGACTFMYFTAGSNRQVTKATMVCGSTARSTPTLIRIGLYTVAANGDMTLVASTPNDTALLASSYTPYEKALSVAYTFVPGQRYAAALLEVATTPGNVYGCPSFVSNAGISPRICATKTGLSDLPASQTDATLTANNEKMFWIAFS